MKMKKEIRMVQGFSYAHCAVIEKLGIKTRFVRSLKELTTWGRTTVLEDIALRPEYASEIPAFSDFNETWEIFINSRSAIIAFIKSSYIGKMAYVEAFESVGVDITLREFNNLFMSMVKDLSITRMFAEKIDPRHITQKLIVHILQDAARRWHEGRTINEWR